MKYLLTLLLFVSSQLCKAQNYRFQFYLTKSCSTIAQLDTSYSLVYFKSESEELVYKPVNGTVTLPGPNNYYIHFNDGGPLMDSSRVEILDTGLVIFNYKVPDVYEFIGPELHAERIYMRCHVPINGYAEELFEDGTVKLRGNFKAGRIKDSIVYFYPGGKMKGRKRSYRKRYTFEAFDSSGVLKSYHKSVKYNVFVGRPSKWSETTYYPNGKTKIKERTNQLIRRFQEFYPSGKLYSRQTRKKKTDYRENGVKLASYSWQQKKDKYGAEIQLVYQDKYDEYGKLSESWVLGTYWCQLPQPRWTDPKDYHVISVTKYKDGKVVSKVVEPEVDDYKFKPSPIL
ncbi:MAG: hypothetical protein V4594_00090 [Bacteroidota bacterium]